jgi:UDP-N-acetylmuramoyl-tripeptide--D-alanyl-D-alanine ligase
MSLAFVKRPLWTTADAQAATGGVALGPRWLASGIATDIRTLERGDLFVALGDGHASVAAAFERGAAAALIDESGLTVETAGGPLLRVEDSAKGLAALAMAARARSLAKVVAIAGDSGVGEVLRHVLARQGSTHAAVGIDGDVEMSVALAGLPLDARFGVFELGADRFDDAARMLRADVAVVTAVEPAEGHRFVGASGGQVVLDRDSPHFAALAHVGRVIGFGENAAADVRLLGCGTDANGSDVAALVLGRELRYRVGAPGLHQVRNSLAVLAAVAALGADVGAAAAALAGASSPAGRGARRRVALGGGDIELIDESDSGSPASLHAMLSTLATAKPAAGGRRVLVLGDMPAPEAGAEALHVGLAPGIEAAGVSQVFTCGPHMEKLRSALPASLRASHATDPARLAQRVVEGLRAGDVVAVEGSPGSKMRVVVDAILAMGAVTGGSGKG